MMQILRIRRGYIQYYFTSENNTFSQRAAVREWEGIFPHDFIVTKRGLTGYKPIY